MAKDTLNVTLPTELAAAVRAIAQADHLPVRYTVSRLLSAGIRAEPLRAVPNPPLPPQLPPPSPRDEHAYEAVLRVVMLVILDHLPRLAGPEGIKLGWLLRRLYPPERVRGEALGDDGFSELREAIETLAPPAREGAMPDARALGKAFAHLRDRWCGGKRLAARKGHGAALRWFVQEAPTKAAPMT